MYKCSVPGCMHVFEILTVNHVNSHGLTSKQDLFDTYGVPIPLAVDTKKVKANVNMFVPLTPVNKQYHLDKVSQEYRKEMLKK